MKNKPDRADSNLRQTMAARIEIKELGDPARQKAISDAVQALLLRIVQAQQLRVITEDDDK